LLQQSALTQPVELICIFLLWLIFMHSWRHQFQYVHIKQLWEEPIKHFHHKYFLLQSTIRLKGAKLVWWSFRHIEYCLTGMILFWNLCTSDMTEDSQGLFRIKSRSVCKQSGQQPSASGVCVHLWTSLSWKASRELWELIFNQRSWPKSLYSSWEFHDNSQSASLFWK